MNGQIFVLFLFITVVIGVLSLIANMYFAYYYKYYEFKNNKIILHLNETLNSKFIYSFVPRIKCQASEEKLILGYWDGTKGICLCFGKKKEGDTCQEKGCVTIGEIKPKGYTVFEGKEMCVIRKGESYFDMVKSGKIIAKEKSCSETQKLCGIVDTFGRKLCVNQDEDCPLNKSSIDKIYKETHLNKFISDKNNLLINFLDEENAENKIISIIKLSDGLPCLNISQKNWISYHEEEKYKIQKCTPINGKTFDDRYQKFENFHTKKIDLYRDNFLSYYITPSLEKDSNIINLYGTTFLGLDVKEDGFNYEKIISTQDLLNSCGIAMFFVSLAIIVIIVILAIFFKKCCGTHYGEEYIKYFLIYSGIVICIGFVANLILCIIIYASIQRVEWFLKGSLNIGDDALKLLINELITKYSFNQTFSLAIIISGAVFFCFGVITIFLYFQVKNFEN